MDIAGKTLELRQHSLFRDNLKMLVWRHLQKANIHCESKLLFSKLLSLINVNKTNTYRQIDIQSFSFNGIIEVDQIQVAVFSLEHFSNLTYSTLGQ